MADEPAEPRKFALAGVNWHQHIEHEKVTVYPVLLIVYPDEIPRVARILQTRKQKEEGPPLHPVILDKFGQTFTADEIRARADMGILGQLKALGHDVPKEAPVVATEEVS